MALKSTDAELPDPLRETPPEDRFCDLVLNGGVASGVVYPWALLHLARHYRFRRIGGNSVGAMAAALAAAAEYGRCCGHADAFEPLRLSPLALAEEDRPGGRTRMFRLFQPAPRLRRLFDAFVLLTQTPAPVTLPKSEDGEAPGTRPPPPRRTRAQRASGFVITLVRLLGLYGAWRVWAWSTLGLCLFAGWLLQCLGAPLVNGDTMVLAAVFAVPGGIVLALIWLLVHLLRDARALADHGFGLCSGRAPPIGPDPGIVEWLHEGIQRSAGLMREDRPLTFADLWSAPRFGRAGPGARTTGGAPALPGIDLQMFASNVTQGRPIRLPLNDDNTRLYFRPSEWAAYFPPTVLNALVAAATPYAPRSASDPPAPALIAGEASPASDLMELPAGGMPIVVAARMSLCFPLLFSAMKVYAIDYEMLGSRLLRPCWLSDGGLCSNFPVHLFDAAHPRHPTFALLLDSRLADHEKQSVWLPKEHLAGRGDNWQRMVPGAGDETETPCAVRQLGGFALGLVLTMKDWNDRVTARMPQVRNRVLRMALRPWEGQLNIGMSRRTMLEMATEYGTRGGKKLVETFCAQQGEAPTTAWRQHLYVRSLVEVLALREHLRGYAAAVAACANTVPLREILADATASSPLVVKADRPDPAARTPTPEQQAALEAAVAAIEALERALTAADFGPYRALLQPELRLRPPV